MLKVNYVDKAPGSKNDCTVTCVDKKSYIDLAKLNNDNTRINQYSSNELNRTLLDGSFYDLPVSPLNQVYESASMSGADGGFTTPIVITRTFTNQYEAPGITFTFDNGTDQCWCNDLNVKWYRGSTLLYSEDYQPDAPFYFCQKNVSAFDKVVITFNSTNKPYRFLRIVNIDDGVDREFTEEELLNIRIIEEISEAGDELSINTADIDIIAKSNIDYVFQRTQPISIYKDNVLISKMFNENTEKNIGPKYQISAEDYIGILDKEMFLGGIYTNYSLKTLLTEICGDIPHDYSGNEKINGYLPAMTRREALQYVAFASMKVIDCSRSDLIQVRTLSQTISDIPDSRVMRYPTEITEQRVTKIVISEHSLVPNTETTELINEEVNGTYTYTWSEPHHNYLITGGTLVESGANYATVTGTGETLILSAMGYDDVERRISTNNPLYISTDLPNVIEKSDNRLITSANVSAVLTYLSGIYFKNKTLKATIILDNEKVGDKVSISTGTSTVVGVITSMELDLLKNLANIEISEVA